MPDVLICLPAVSTRAWLVLATCEAEVCSVFRRSASSADFLLASAASETRWYASFCLAIAIFCLLS